MIAPDEPGEQRDWNADQRCPDEEILEARVCTMTKPEAPASRLPGSAQSEVISAYWLAANFVDASEDM